MDHLQALIDQASAGNQPADYDITISWNPVRWGPVYRVRDRNGHEASGTLEFVGWSEVATNGYHLHEYFGADRGYSGPDRYGVHPVFIAG